MKTGTLRWQQQGSRSWPAAASLTGGGESVWLTEGLCRGVRLSRARASPMAQSAGSHRELPLQVGRVSLNRQ
jgi:hypothetical protein